MAASEPEVHNVNPFVKDLNSLYNGIEMVQLEDHVNDADDLVPEFSAEIVAQKEHVKVEEKHYGFDGQEIKEVYDEWKISRQWSKIWYLSNKNPLTK